jgi:hypothetical protein
MSIQHMKIFSEVFSTGTAHCPKCCAKLNIDKTNEAVIARCPEGCWQQVLETKNHPDRSYTSPAASVYLDGEDKS